MQSHAVCQTVNKLAASATSPDRVKFQAVIKSAARAASLRGGRASGRFDHVFFVIFGRASGPKNNQNHGLCSWSPKSFNFNLSAHESRASGQLSSRKEHPLSVLRKGCRVNTQLGSHKSPYLKGPQRRFFINF